MSVSEREYAREARPHLYADPEDVCFRCEGAGLIRFFDADCGWLHLPCMVCSGVATAGVFVVQVATERFRHELRYQTDDFHRATDRAGWAANLFARLGGRCMGYRAEEVRVVFKPLPAGPEEVVAAYTVPSPDRPRPAA